MADTSIIICTRDRAASLRRTLAALAGVQIPVGMAVELIVVDNGSTDETAAVVRDFKFEHPLKYVLEPLAGVSRAKNRGLLEAKGEIIAFLDDDVVPAEDWLGRLCAPLMNGMADAVAGGVRIAPYLIAPWMSAFHRQWFATTEFLNPRDPERLIGANMAISRAVLERVPGFDDELGPGSIRGTGEETLFSEQLKEAGFRIGAAFDSVVDHHFSESRMRPEWWIKAARALGMVDAYLGYHWKHTDWPRPEWKAFTSRMRLARRRFTHLFNQRIGPPEALLMATRDYHAWRQYLEERKRPRNYEKRGLKKLKG